MSSGNLYHDNKYSIAITPANGVAGQTDIEGVELDMADYEGVMAIVTFGAIDGGAVTSLKWQQDTATGMASAADLLGSSVTVADTDDNKVKVLDLKNPSEQFVRLYVTRGTQDATIASAVYVQYGARVKPVTHGSNVAGESHVAPAEGTA